ncbi:uncharacterized protein EI97DRAFT_429198 [Westerdykella ornata]|uniref:Squalene/phytoene synthase n=1 Tax=Westerdykella ornata TaxID=318751 RepID=A0A6A6JXJ8_WESOR|nr:uncharacterized protein EI97DRAFT_429198 [Westerdykella ornata]KAF2281137.1 hypothetical protein EI97DRAFT_429198 [Westerdykella ornata]
MRPSRLCTSPLQRQWERYRVSTVARRFVSYSPYKRYNPPGAENVEAAREQCMALIRKYDFPSQNLGIYVPPTARDAYIAIRAFNVEIARIADTTSTPSIGMMRMQFWKDAVTNALHGKPPMEPTAVMIAQAQGAVQHYSEGKVKLSRHWFHRVINARAQQLGNPPYPTLSALETYAENTYSTLLYLTLQSLPQASVTTDHLASHIGKAQGIVAVLRGLPLLAFPDPQPLSKSGAVTGQSGPSQGAVMLPLDVMAEANVKEEDVFRQGGSAPGLRDAVFKVATRANDHLITAREMLAKLRSEGTVGHEFEHQNEEGRRYSQQELSSGPEAQLAEVERAFGILMPPAVTAQTWLDTLQKVDFDIFDQRLRGTDWRLPWRAYWAYKRRKL